MYDYELIEEVVHKLGPGVMICLETAADYLGLSNMGYSENYKVYSIEHFEHDGVEVIEEKDAFSTKRYTVDNGIACTTPEQTILDMLENENDVDIQILLESLSNYYYKHDESFEQLTELADMHQKQVLESYGQDAIDYYTDD